MVLMAALAAGCASSPSGEAAPAVEREGRATQPVVARPTPTAPNPPRYHWDPCVIVSVGDGHVVLNKGSAHGMRQGDRLVVQHNEREIAIVRVVQIETQRSVAVPTRTYRTAPEIGDTLEPHLD
jgi:hypothetical protein